MEKNEDPTKVFAAKIVGVLGAFTVHLRVENMNLKIVEVLTTRKEF